MTTEKKKRRKNIQRESTQKWCLEKLVQKPPNNKHTKPSFSVIGFSSSVFFFSVVNYVISFFHVLLAFVSILWRDVTEKKFLYLEYTHTHTHTHIHTHIYIYIYICTEQNIKRKVWWSTESRLKTCWFHLLGIVINSCVTVLPGNVIYFQMRSLKPERQSVSWHHLFLKI